MIAYISRLHPIAMFRAFYLPPSRLCKSLQGQVAGFSSACTVFALRESFQVAIKQLVSQRDRMPIVHCLDPQVRSKAANSEAEKEAARGQQKPQYLPTVSHGLHWCPWWAVMLTGIFYYSSFHMR